MALLRGFREARYVEFDKNEHCVVVVCSIVFILLSI